MSIITLTTDFGAADWFVGSMKGVILGINPQTTVVDITHEVPAGDIRAGAFALMAGYRSFARGTVHVAVVDPGVGGPRAALAVRTASCVFVGPDNGVLSWALRWEKVEEVRRLENADYFRHPVCPTFHGRDVFAPVAAHLSKGVKFDALGPLTGEWVNQPWPEPTAHGGEIIYIDRFGNAITNLREAATAVIVGGQEIPVRPFYQAVPAGQPLALISSTGLLEIAVNGGCAARGLGLKVGHVVNLR